MHCDIVGWFAIDVWVWDCEEQDGGAVIWRFFARNSLEFSKNSTSASFHAFLNSPDNSHSILISLQLLLDYRILPKVKENPLDDVVT